MGASPLSSNSPLINPLSTQESTPSTTIRPKETSPLNAKTIIVSTSKIQNLGANLEKTRMPNEIVAPPSSLALPTLRKQSIHNITDKNGITRPDQKGILSAISPSISKTEIPPPLASQNTFINEELYGDNIKIIKDLLINNNNNLYNAVNLFDTGNIKLTANSEALSNNCISLIKNHEKLFSNPAELENEWTAFAQKNPAITGKPTFNLDGKGYHNIGHAKEMFYDTYEKLFNKGLPESTCMAGAAMAFFHDLIQGMDGFPQLGKNEDITSKFLAHLIDKNDAMPFSVKETIKTLADATIVGGTFLLKVKNEKGELKNISLSEHADKQITGTSPSLAILKTIRETLAFNDISRTMGYEEPTTRKKNELMKSISEFKAKSGNSFHKKIEGNNIAEQIFYKHGKNFVGRLFQSIRMQTEFPVGTKQKIENGALVVKDSKPVMEQILLPDKKEIIQKLKNNELDKDDPISLLVGKLKKEGTWIEGPFSEASFALQSNHTDYANMLKSNIKLFTQSENDQVIKGLITLALSTGQDGSTFPSPGDILTPSPHQ